MDINPECVGCATTFVLKEDCNRTHDLLTGTCRLNDARMRALEDLSIRQQALMEKLSEPKKTSFWTSKTGQTVAIGGVIVLVLMVCFALGISVRLSDLKGVIPGVT